MEIVDKVKVMAIEGNEMLVKHRADKYKLLLSEGQREFCFMFDVRKNSTIKVIGKVNNKLHYFGENGVPCKQLFTTQLELVK